MGCRTWWLDFAKEWSTRQHHPFSWPRSSRPDYAGIGARSPDGNGSKMRPMVRQWGMGPRRDLARSRKVVGEGQASSRRSHRHEECRTARSGVPCTRRGDRGRELEIVGSAEKDPCGVEGFSCKLRPALENIARRKARAVWGKNTLVNFDERQPPPTPSAAHASR